MTTGTRAIGDFCWINMLTPKPDEACGFFGAVLGWTFGAIPGMGFRVQVDRHDIGGLFDLAGPNTPPGTPPLIGVMIKVASADAAAARVTSLGGRAMPPFDISEQGRMAVCFDPPGAEFDVWEPRKGPGTDVDLDVHGAPSWFENVTTDAGAGAEFYARTFGWTPESMPMPSGAYTTFKLGDTHIAGMVRLRPDSVAQRPHWATYFTVNDADAAAREALALGARLAAPLHDIPGVGRSCGIVSPQGVPFHVIRYTR